jgi:hypothetical protein
MSKQLIHWVPGGLYPICGQKHGYHRGAGFKKEITCKRCKKLATEKRSTK